MNPRQSEAKNVYILLVEASESLSIQIERCFHESSRLTDIVTHLIASPESHFDDQALLDELRRKQYDCLLMDLQLPGQLDAFDLCQKVGHMLNPAPAVVLIGDQTETQAYQRAQQVGAAHLIDRRELTPASLRAVIDIAVGQQKRMADPDSSVSP